MKTRKPWRQPCKPRKNLETYYLCVSLCLYQDDPCVYLTAASLTNKLPSSDKNAMPRPPCRAGRAASFILFPAHLSYEETPPSSDKKKPRHSSATRAASRSLPVYYLCLLLRATGVTCFLPWVYKKAERTLAAANDWKWNTFTSIAGWKQNRRVRLRF